MRPSPRDLRQPEIEQLHALLGHQDVGRLQIPMRDPLGVRRFQRGRHLQRQPKRFFHRQRPAQRCTLDILHHQVIRADIVQRQICGWFRAAMARASCSNRSL